MKGFIAATLTAACLAGGCTGYRQVVDPCYPERYGYMARQEVVAAFAPQVHNGHVLDQTVWNTFFEFGTDRLTPGGMEFLTYLARRRPSPDPVVYLQTSHDLETPYDPEHPDKFANARGQLDAQRVQAVEKFLAAYECGHRGVPFTVIVHDPQEVGLSGVPVNVSVTKMQLSAEGQLRVYSGTRVGG